MPADEFKQCRVLLQQKRFAEADNLASKLIIQFPNCVESLKVLFDTSIALGKIVEAEVMLNRLEENDCIDQRRKKICEHFKQLVKEFNHQNYKKCIEHIATLRSNDIKVSIHLIKMWVICTIKESQDLEQVERELDAALTGMPGQLSGLYLKGLIRYHQGKLKESLELLNQVSLARASPPLAKFSFDFSAVPGA